MPHRSPSEPLLRSKQSALDIQDLKGLLHLRWRWGDWVVLDAHYTRIDQVFMLWGLIAGVIFMTAEWAPLLWTTQALLWSVVTLSISAIMIRLSWCWARIERLRWLVCFWASLMLLGVVITDIGIFGHWGWLMGHLCLLWLELCAFGYGVSAIAVQSRSLGTVGLIHGLSGVAIANLSTHSFGMTALIMAGTLLLLGEYQWDMRPPIHFHHLTPEERQFNQQQQLLRQSCL
ncbi:hypothetical protein GS597_15245 [Synechococcales cyanobacterium C]|uniref:Uncharacterized protein n=1 Tax=Petrachloros mirabilis ULC683 TaxID=2781853 RepID=A0A8K2A940_9CYAN|nr:hypothetical protein [Petrachloros mirabilis]NCJ07839.1 hypothetical protein [Petrachloros mirabilis ULC683]